MQQHYIDNDFVCPEATQLTTEGKDAWVDMACSKSYVHRYDAGMRLMLALCTCFEFMAAVVATGMLRDKAKSIWPTVMHWICVISIVLFMVAEHRHTARLNMMRIVREYTTEPHRKIRKNVYVAHVAGLALGMALLVASFRAGNTELCAAVLAFATVHFMFNAHYALHSQLRRLH